MTKPHSRMTSKTANLAILHGLVILAPPSGAQSGSEGLPLWELGIEAAVYHQPNYPGSDLRRRPLRFGSLPPGFGVLFRYVKTLTPWGMMDVFLLGILVFVASVFVPLMKLILLTYLAASVQRGSTWRPRERTRLYRITEAVGRWSMVDIYVVTILVALVNLGNLATIKAGPGAGFFAAVVVITMIAAMSFDPRLIWDAKETRDE